MSKFGLFKNLRNSMYLASLSAVCSLALLSGCQPNNHDTSDNSQSTAELNANHQQHNVEIWPELNLAIQPDPAIEKRIKTILAGMTLEQKVAQVIQPEIRDITVEDMRKYGFGSYLNGGGAYPNNDKQASVSDWVELAEAMYQASVDDSLDGSNIPTIWGTDAVHGHNNVIGATIFPHNIGLGAANDPQLIYRIALATSIEVQATGIDWIFAPTVAAARDDRWGRTYESYSEDPEIIGAYSKAIVEGLQGNLETGFFSDDKVISTVKHFLGDGGTENGDDQGNNTATEQQLFDIHAQGYVGGLSAGAQTVMASFNSWHGEKIHGNRYLLTDVLKDRMGFDGLVVGDWNGHGQIPGCSNESCSQAMNAGLDIYMVPTAAWKPLYENLVKQVKSGDIPMSRLDDAVSRILRVKLRAGIFDKPSPAQRPYANKNELIGAQEHKLVAREAVRKSLVLLKNNNRLLPLSGKQHYLVTGSGADNIGKQSGGWSVTWQGTGNQNSDFPSGTSIYQGIQEIVQNNGGSAEVSELGDFVQTPDVAIVVFGEEPYAEGNGDLANLEYQRGNKSDLALLRQFQAQNIPVVSLFISGRPMWVNPEMNQSDAFVAVWLPGTEGAGIADVLFTDANGEIRHDFTGRLSFSWPATPQQHANRGDTATNPPLFSYGYGLSYQSTAQNLKSLTEEVSESSDPLEARVIYQGSVKAPWQLNLVDEDEREVMTSSVLEISSVNIRTRDRRIQEDSLEASWNDAGTVSMFSPFPVDLLGYQEANASLFFDLRVINLGSALSLKMVCMEPCEHHIDLTAELQQLNRQEWHTFALPLRCLADAGVELGKIMAPFELHSNKGTQIQFSDVVIAQPESTTEFIIPQMCAGE